MRGKQLHAQGEAALPDQPANTVERDVERFAARGGRLRAIPCLNAAPAHAEAIAAIARRAFDGAA